MVLSYRIPRTLVIPPQGGATKTNFIHYKANIMNKLITRFAFASMLPVAMVSPPPPPPPPHTHTHSRGGKYYEQTHHPIRFCLRVAGGNRYRFPLFFAQLPAHLAGVYRRRPALGPRHAGTGADQIFTYPRRDHSHIYYVYMGCSRGVPMNTGCLGSLKVLLRGYTLRLERSSPTPIGS